MALYRKYRPATFAEVVGQEHVTEPLSTALSAGRINHAYQSTVASTIAAGTSEVNRNVIATRGLGLPRG